MVCFCEVKNTARCGALRHETHGVRNRYTLMATINEGSLFSWITSHARNFMIANIPAKRVDANVTANVRLAMPTSGRDAETKVRIISPASAKMPVETDTTAGCRS